MEQRTMGIEEQRAQGALAHGDAVLKMVGWYCAGGHDDGHGGTVANPTVRLDDPCAYGVPMFVLVEHPGKLDRQPTQTISDQVNDRVRRAWDDEFHGIPASHPENPGDQ